MFFTPPFLLCIVFQSLTNGSGFYKAEGKEMLTEGRRLVLRNKETGEFIDDFTGKCKGEKYKLVLP